MPIIPPWQGSLSNRAAARLEKWKGLLVAYIAMLVYGLVLLVHGQRLRLAGATREDLLDGMDDFLLPGMGILLLLTSLFCVARATRLQFCCMFIIFLLIDVTYNGKIFSFWRWFCFLCDWTILALLLVSLLRHFYFGVAWHIYVAILWLHAHIISGR